MVRSALGRFGRFAAIRCAWLSFMSMPHVGSQRAGGGWQEDHPSCSPSPAAPLLQALNFPAPGICSSPPG
eukprot:15275632-Alexandrium_andersonii.AAC.1